MHRADGSEPCVTGEKLSHQLGSRRVRGPEGAGAAGGADGGVGLERRGLCLEIGFSSVSAPLGSGPLCSMTLASPGSLASVWDGPCARSI